MASCIGLELSFRCALPSITKKTDVLVVFIHWKLISDGYSCLGLDTESNQNGEASELLPDKWSASSDLYQLKYLKDGNNYILKCIIVEKQLLVSLVRVKDGEVSSLTLDEDIQIHDSFTNFKETFCNRTNLEKLVEKDLIEPLVEKKKSRLVREQRPSEVSHENPLVVPRFLPERSNQFFPDIGSGDLDPFGRGGGMLMDPRQMRHPPVNPSNLPPGAVPPGARFDPFGPEPPQQFPPGRFGTPRPRGGFGDPDPDHLPPPGLDDDMFM